MLQRLEGKVSYYKRVTNRKVQFELVGISKIIELTVSESWVINRGDHVVVAGEEDTQTGKFVGYAYRNSTKSVFGQFDAGVALGYIFVIAGLIFFWAIFPLFTHVPAGVRAISLGRRVSQAASML